MEKRETRRLAWYLVWCCAAWAAAVAVPVVWNGGVGQYVYQHEQMHVFYNYAGGVMLIWMTVISLAISVTGAAINTAARPSQRREVERQERDLRRREFDVACMAARELLEQAIVAARPMGMLHLRQKQRVDEVARDMVDLNQEAANEFIQDPLVHEALTLGEPGMRLLRQKAAHAATHVVAADRVRQSEALAAEEARQQSISDERLAVQAGQQAHARLLADAMGLPMQ